MTAFKCTFMPCAQAIAKLVMPDKGWAYYSSAADDEITLRENHAAYHRYARSLIMSHEKRTNRTSHNLEYGSDQEFCVMLRELTFQQQYLARRPPCHSILYVIIINYTDSR